eukprot:TRINITY_DN8808_c0_g1_i1.p1 TRINITY_DN8808_c0_g1~~TRINITY_DN8808_c0_g1_i1.p1  ORF type:complete len:188 (-),score=9.97 TRINITY_DN8808_c0_g1_i1:111-674(-)
MLLQFFIIFSQLRFYSKPQQQGYAGDELYFPIQITADKKHYDINLHFSDRSIHSPCEKLAQCQQGSHEVNLAYKSSKRGKHALGRVTIFSEYSLGFFKSKTILDFGHYAIIYPKPMSLNAGQYQHSSPAGEPSIDSYQTSTIEGTDDFSELKSFVIGESKARTAWKQLAKGQGHYQSIIKQAKNQIK